MQSKGLAVLLLASMTVLVSASPLAIDAREGARPTISEVVREANPQPEPGCQRYGCF
ncbi:hypothetical protein BDQ17DRAFT_1545690 [Cyathus striatus]|nr:hypothetical protein BDQ17DRAFT_1545690 [Cyathus striatus]